MVPTEAFSASLDTLFVYHSAERLDAYPEALIRDVNRTDERVVLTTIDGKTYTYLLSCVDSVSNCPPDSLPRFLSFKFNNKYNDQLFTDVQADIFDDSRIVASVSAIGHWLTASFQLSDTLAEAYVNQILQQSKVSRCRFDTDVSYTVARPGWQVLTADADADTLCWQLFGRSYSVHVDWLADQASTFPTLHLTTADGQLPSSKDIYVDGTLRIDGAGVWADMPEASLQIKGRGNTTWSSDPTAKNPYRLKFPSGVKPFGLTRGKSWVLLSNAQTGAMLTGCIGMKAAHLMGCVAANHIVPVELYVNGGYRGSYNLTEKIGFSNNSIDLADESRAYLLEIDTYQEPLRFRTDAFYMPVNIKEPDFAADSPSTLLTRQSIVDDINSLMTAVDAKADITHLVDVEHLAAYLSLNELIANYEIMHPKSVYLYKQNLTDGSPFVFGPVWDFDWAYGYEGRRSYYMGAENDDFYASPAFTYSGNGNAKEADRFWKHLRYGSEAIDRACYVVWYRFLQGGGIDELIDYVRHYYQFAAPSFAHNSALWGDGAQYATLLDRAASWLQRRATYIFSQLTPYELTDDELSLPIRWKPSLPSADEVPCTSVSSREDTFAHTRFSVYSLQGICLKPSATFDTWRDGLPRGIYIVNGKRVLVK